MQNEHDMQDELDALRQNYIRDLAARFAEIDAAWLAVRRQGCDGEALQTLLRLSHKLAGSSGLFGLMRVSASARALESLLGEIAECGIAVDEQYVETIAGLIATIKSSAPA